MVRIDSTYFGSIIVNGEKFDGDMIICWDGELRERQSSHLFSKEELRELLMKDPEAIIIGTGTAGLMKIDPSIEITAKMEGISIHKHKSVKAIQEFNKLARKNKRAIAVIHVTC